MSLKISHELIFQVEEIIAKIRCGESYQRAVQNIKSIHINKELIQEWLPIRQEILEGKLSSLNSLELFLKRLKTKKKFTELIHKKTLSSQWQSNISTLVFFVFIGALYLFSSETFTQHKWITALSLFLIFIGYLIAIKLKKKFLEKLDFYTYIDLFSKLHLKISWGQELSSALHEELKNSELKKLGPETLQFLSILSKKLKNGQPITQETIPKTKAKKEVHIKNAHNFMLSLSKNYSRGVSIKEYLGNAIESFENDFKDLIEKEAERNAFYSLIPVLLFQAPAMLLQIYLPLLIGMSQFSF